MRNPFHNYQPPETIKFSADLCKWVVQRKADRLSERAARDLLEGGHIADFLEGNYVVDIDYDCAELRPFVIFASRATQLKFVTKAVVTGIEAAMHLAEVKNPPLEVCLIPQFSEEMPDVANIRVMLEPRD